MTNKILNNYIHDLTNALLKIDLKTIENIINEINAVMERKGTVYLIGNGGSSATPSHSAGDWSKELGIRTICLTDNIPSVTAFANDTDYSNIFVGQLKIFLDTGDLLIAYSGSGNSENIISAVNYAKSMGILTIGMTGNYKNEKGGKLAKLADISIVADTLSMERIEDLHLIINHMIKEVILNAKKLQ